MTTLPTVTSPATDLEALASKPLAAASAVDIVTALKMLFRAFETRVAERATAAEVEEAQRETMQTYIAALHGHPLWAIEEAVLMFVQGRRKPASKKFVPRPPEVGEVIIELVEQVKSARRQAQRKRDEQRVEAKEEKEFTPEHRARMKLKMAVFNRLGGEVAQQCIAEGGIAPYIRVAIEAGIDIPEGLVSEAEVGEEALT